MRTEALRILDQLRGHKYVMPYWVALIHTGLRDRDEAFRWLDAAFAERSPFLAYANGDPRPRLSASRSSLPGPAGAHEAGASMNGVMQDESSGPHAMRLIIRL